MRFSHAAVVISELFVILKVSINVGCINTQKSCFGLLLIVKVLSLNSHFNKLSSFCILHISITFLSVYHRSSKKYSLNITNSLSVLEKSKLYLSIHTLALNSSAEFNASMQFELYNPISVTTILGIPTLFGTTTFLNLQEKPIASNDTCIFSFSSEIIFGKVL